MRGKKQENNDMMCNMHVKRKIYSMTLVDSKRELLETRPEELPAALLLG